jgi:hypothetical protein
LQAVGAVELVVVILEIHINILAEVEVAPEDC